MSSNVFPSKGIYEVVKRENVFKESEHEWALNIDVGAGYWTLCAFENRPPTQEEIDDVIEIAVRAIEIYHKSIKFPSYKMKIEEDKENGK